MHATGVHVNIHDQAEAERARPGVHPDARAPGLVGANFVAMDDTHGVSIQVFEPEEKAKGRR